MKYHCSSQVHSTERLAKINNCCWCESRCLQLNAKKTERIVVRNKMNECRIEPRGTQVRVGP